MRLRKTVFASRPWCAKNGVSLNIAFEEKLYASDALSTINFNDLCSFSVLPNFLLLPNVLSPDPCLGDRLRVSR